MKDLTSNRIVGYIALVSLIATIVGFIFYPPIIAFTWIPFLVTITLYCGCVKGSKDDERAMYNTRHISQSVKNTVWRRDMGRCVQCGSQERLEFDQIIPVSKGGSNTARNIQLLCERCNRRKGGNI